MWRIILGPASPKMNWENISVREAFQCGLSESKMYNKQFLWCRDLSLICQHVLCLLKMLMIHGIPSLVYNFTYISQVLSCGWTYDNEGQSHRRLTWADLIVFVLWVDVIMVSVWVGTCMDRYWWRKTNKTKTNYLPLQQTGQKIQMLMGYSHLE